MIVESYDKMRTYLPSLSIKGSRKDLFDDYRQIAQDELEQKILGEELVALLESDLTEPDLHAKLRTKVERAISVSAFLKGMASVDLVLTDMGFAVENSTAMTPASRQRVDALKNSLQEQLDNSIDDIILFLMKSSTYEDWRGSTQFEDITSGLIATFREFKQFAPLTAVVRERYPKNYSEFALLYSNLSQSLMLKISPSISEDYCSELLEKYRDGDFISVEERSLVSYIKYAVCSFALQDDTLGNSLVQKAVSFMKSNLSKFPTYAASPEAAELSYDRDDSPVYSMM